MNILKTSVSTLCMCLFVVFTNQAQTKKGVSQGYVLEGTITGLEDGTTIKLIPGATHSSEPAVAETTLKGGKFILTGKLNEPQFFFVEFNKNKGFIPVLVENSKIKLTAAATVSKEEDGKITFKDEVVSGSKSNDYYVKEVAFKEELNKDYTDYHKGIEEISNEIGKARAAKNKKLTDSLENTAAWKEFSAKEKAFFDKVQNKYETLILKHKATWWGPFFMMTQFSYLTPEQKPLFDQFSDEAKKSYYGKLAEKDIYPKSLIGTSVATFNLKDKDGKSLSIKEITAGKKYILIDFWASWCGPCRKEIPNLKTAYTAYSDKGFGILSISIDKDDKLWQKALAQENMPWTNLYDDDKVSNAFNVKTIPATFLIDQNGKIISDNLRGAALEEKLKELLKS